MYDLHKRINAAISSTEHEQPRQAAVSWDRRHHRHRRWRCASVTGLSRPPKSRLQSSDQQQRHPTSASSSFDEDSCRPLFCDVHAPPAECARLHPPTHKRMTLKSRQTGTSPVTSIDSFQHQRKTFPGSSNRSAMWRFSGSCSSLDNLRQWVSRV